MHCYSWAPLLHDHTVNITISKEIVPLPTGSELLYIPAYKYGRNLVCCTLHFGKGVVDMGPVVVHPVMGQNSMCIVS